MNLKRCRQFPDGDLLKGEPFCVAGLAKTLTQVAHLYGAVLPEPDQLILYLGIRSRLLEQPCRRRKTGVEPRIP